jgi:hypothetical protein
VSQIYSQTVAEVFKLMGIFDKTPEILINGVFMSKVNDAVSVTD